jgi:hypothetical protein
MVKQLHPPVYIPGTGYDTANDIRVLDFSIDTITVKTKKECNSVSVRFEAKRNLGHGNFYVISQEVSIDTIHDLHSEFVSFVGQKVLLSPRAFENAKEAITRLALKLSNN